MFDIHCHILPGLDDGAFSEDESISMAEIAAANGTRFICCTPHSGEYTFDELLETFRRFRNTVEQSGIPVRLFLGQEIYITDNYHKQIRDIENGYPVTINRSMFPLVEFHPRVSASTAFASVEMLVSAGFVPVIAHPERYIFVSGDTDNAKVLKKLGALLQINIGSLKGTFGNLAERTANYLLYKRMADFAASDAHSPFSRTPRLRGAHAYVSEQYSMDYADYIMRENPHRLVNNEKIYQYL